MTATTDVPFASLLSNIVDNRGRTAPTADTGIPLIATNCIKEDGLYPVFEKVRYVDTQTYESWFRAHPEAGDILFVCKGSPGRVALVPDPVSFCIAQDMVAVRANPAAVYPRYLFAALRSKLVRQRIDNMHVGTLIPHFKKGDFGNLLIPIVDEALQVTIGDLYYELSRKIESNKRAISIMERLGAALLKARLVLDAYGLPEYSDSRLGDYLSIVETGSRPKGGVSASDDGIVSLGGENIESAGINTATSFKRVPSEFALSMKRGRLQDEDVLVYKDGSALSMSSDASIVSAYGYGSPIADATINEHVYRVRAKDGVSQALLYWLLRSPWMDHELRKRATGAAIPGLNSTNFRDAPVPRIDAHVVLELNEALSPLLVGMLRRGSETRLLASLRDAMLTDFLSDRVELSDRSHAAEVAA